MKKRLAIHLLMDDTYFTASQRARLLALGELKFFKGLARDEDELVERLDCDAVIAGKTRMPRDVLKKANCRLISLIMTGVDHIDTEAASEYGITVSNARGECQAQSVAEHVLALMLALTRRLPLAQEAFGRGEYLHWKPFLTTELSQKTLGIVGAGQIGSRVGRLGECLGMKVQASVKRPDAKRDFPERIVALDELLATSDFVSLHVPLNDDTRHMINRGKLMLMKTSAYLINTSRADVVKEEDLIGALDEGIIAGAGLDVIERKKDNPLFGRENVVITPHTAWATREAMERLRDAAIENLEAWVRDKL